MKTRKSSIPIYDPARQKVIRTITSVRQARPVDASLLLTLEREFDRDERELVLEDNPKAKPYLRTSDAKYSSERMRKWLRSKNALVLIAEADSVPCGFSVAWIATSQGIYEPKRYGFIGIMFVQEEYRQRKVSSLMIQEMSSWFAARKVKHVCLTVLSANKIAHFIYEKWGFADFATTMWKSN